MCELCLIYKIIQHIQIVKAIIIAYKYFITENGNLLFLSFIASIFVFE